MTDFPRVLVIAPVVFNQQTGSGVTLSNLFRGWPPDRLAQIHCDGHNEPDYTLCQRYLPLPNLAVQRPSLWQTGLGVLGQGVRYALHREESFLGHWLHTGALQAWVRGFAPDLIYARPHDRPSFFTWLPIRLHHQLGLPVVTYVLDDWPARYEQSPSRAKRLFWRLFVQRDLQRLFDLAAANVGISPQMCEAFGQRYKRPFVPFHNSIDTADWAKIEKNYAAGEPFRLVYIGSLNADKELRGLVDIRQVVLDLRQQGRNVQLVVYGPDPYRPLFDHYLAAETAVVHGGLFPAEAKPHILSRADLLLLPLNFDAASQAYAGYSFQTKVPEYMASGTPTLVYGPAHNPNVHYAAQAGWGQVVNQPNRQLLSDAICQLMDNEYLRATLGQKARQLAFRHHSGERNRAAFQHLLRSVSGEL